MTALAGIGVLTLDQSTALQAVLVAAGAVLAATSAAVAALRTARDGERDVTPMLDPRDPAGRPLVPMRRPPTPGG